jgi:hypothetical protein
MRCLRAGQWEPKTAQCSTPRGRPSLINQRPLGALARPCPGGRPQRRARHGARPRRRLDWRPLRPELAAPLDVCPLPQLMEGVDGSSCSLLSGGVAVFCCCTSAIRVSIVGAARCALPTRRPSAFRPYASQGAMQTCECPPCRRPAMLAAGCCCCHRCRQPRSGLRRPGR